MSKKKDTLLKIREQLEALDIDISEELDALIEQELDKEDKKSNNKSYGVSIEFVLSTDPSFDIEDIDEMITRSIDDSDMSDYIDGLVKIEVCEEDL